MFTNVVVNKVVEQNKIIKKKKTLIRIIDGFYFVKIAYKLSKFKLIMFKQWFENS